MTGIKQLCSAALLLLAMTDGTRREGTFVAQFCPKSETLPPGNKPDSATLL
jgi:hypothetical protein